MILDPVHRRVLLTDRVFVHALVAGKLVAMHVDISGMLEKALAVNHEWAPVLELKKLVLLVANIGKQFLLHYWELSCFLTAELAV